MYPICVEHERCVRQCCVPAQWTPPDHQQTKYCVTPPHQNQPGCLRSQGLARIAVRHWLAAASPPTAARSATACARNRTTHYHCASTCAYAHSKGAPQTQLSVRAVTQAITKSGTYNTPGSTIWQPTCVACACKTPQATYISTPAAGIGRADGGCQKISVASVVRVWACAWCLSSRVGDSCLW